MAAGKTVTVNGGGELILDGCVMDSQTPGLPYNFTAATNGLLTIARCVVTDAKIDINTLAASVPANLKSKVYDSRFITCDIEATAGSKVYHNLFDAATNTAANTDATTAFDPIDGWGNVTNPANLRNHYTLELRCAGSGLPGPHARCRRQPVRAGRRSGGRQMEVGNLSPHTITGAEALLGYHSGILALQSRPARRRRHPGYRLERNHRRRRRSPRSA